MSAVPGRGKVVRIKASGDPLVLGDGDKFEVPGAPEVLKLDKHRHSAMNVAEVLEGDVTRPADEFVAVL